MKKICEADFWIGAASPGEQEVYHTPSASRALPHLAMLPASAMTRPKIDAPSSEIFEMFRIVSSEEATQLHHRNRSQLTEIIHIVADTADGE